MKIVVVGLGYVGLSNAVLLAQHNHVIGVDISEDRVRAVNARKSPVIDAELSEYLSAKDLNLFASTDLEASVIDADYVIVSTPTSYNETTNFFDTSSVDAVISKVIATNSKTCIVLKSTIPVGFIDEARRRLNSDALIFSPEFLREGKALYDNLYPSRIIVGEKSSRAKVFAKLLAQGALKSNIEFLFTGTREAEAIKLFSNTFLAMRVAFFNELDSYALAKGINSHEIISGVSLDPRIGNYYNNPSFGYGGYCLPKDTKQLLANFDDIPQNLIRAIVDANSTRQDFITSEICKTRPNTIGIYRLVMKTNSDNFRQSSVQGIMTKLKSQNINIIVYEPSLKKQTFFNYEVVNNLNEFKKCSDLIVANRFTQELDDVSHKVFTRDLYHEN